MPHVRVEVEEHDGAWVAPPRQETHAGGRRRGLLVRAVDSAGVAGYGEASPLAGYSTDSLGEARAALQAAAAQGLSIEDGRNTASCTPEREPQPAPERGEWQTPAMDAIDRALASLPSPSASARFALETALLDWMGKRRGAPAHRLMTWRAAERPLALCALVDATTVDALCAEAKRAVDAGFACVKVKIGRDFVSELRALRALREALGDRVALRLDANRRMGDARGELTDAALETLEALARDVGPELVEEPVGAAALAHAAPLPVRVALDESLQAPDAKQRVSVLLSSARCQAVVLKPMALGGVQRSLELARIAREAGADVIVSHAFGGPIERAACAELARALAPRPAMGLALHAGLDAWPGWEAAGVGDMQLDPHELPGLGLREAPR